jgi:transcriptional regulator with XRE-family HTH domain
MAGELRAARLDRGLSQDGIGVAVGLARSRVSMIERGQATGVDLVTWSGLLAAAGLRLSVEAYPLAQPIRDAGHAALLLRLRGELHPSLLWSTEVPMPIRGDLRGWDAMIRGRGWRVAVEAETRPTDLQALLRRIGLKQRDSGIEIVVLLLAQTRRNALLVREYGGTLRETFSLPGATALALLRAGRCPQGSAVLLL